MSHFIKSELIDAYLDYRNDYLTVEKYASDNDLSIADAKTILDLGKKLWLEHCGFLELLKIQGAHKC